MKQYISFKSGFQQRDYDLIYTQMLKVEMYAPMRKKKERW